MSLIYLKNRSNSFNVSYRKLKYHNIKINESINYSINFPTGFLIYFFTKFINLIS